MALAIAAAITAAAYLNAKFHLSKDLAVLRTVRQATRSTQQAREQGQLNLWFNFVETASHYPDVTAIWTREQSYTFREVFAAAARYAQFFRHHGVKPGDLVAFYLQNRPEFMFAWLGLWSIGAAPAAINYHLTGDALVHSLTLSGAKLLLVDPDAECRARIDDRRSTLETDLGLTLITLDETFTTTVLAKFPAEVPEGGQLARDTQGSAPAILLYTSGTTGLPKGCPFTMERLHNGVGIREYSTHDKVGPDGDRWYSAMPLYHGTSAVALMVALVRGTSIAIAPRFSVRDFWRDIRDSQATAFVYVGEIARYLMAAPPSPLDRQHRVRLMYGNGLRPDVWTRFQERFGIAEVGEFFNSTEGVFSLYNYNRGPFSASAVGHHGALSRYLMRDVYAPVAIDPQTGDVQRDPVTGWAIRQPYEIGGEMLVRVPSKAAFPGYWRNPDATDRKFLRDVFQSGDLWYRSGDALRRDADGRWYFLDRLGDTFRWKSENVSTAEVSHVLGEYPGIQEANVYGVLVPSHDGRAGCAALQLTPEAAAKGESLDLTALARFARARLPRYAVPVFLRLVTQTSHIHNHKQNKVPLREEGVEPAKLGTHVVGGQNDQLYWLPPGAEGYVPFGEREWKQLVGGTAKL
ncbi:putative very-long-chain acyl-CoA synthetase family protein (CefD1) [Aspergillus saccharolyticus JOP 1030-1]|uniref:Very long-chain fatty acid transport protein n=1 Tax=Aspergillus saccharolyticus JOP 1030-1 TaxID=1450539 RepID=A0A318ZKU3_9EURO|nr:acetyl-CoA synthetase-like protein [Aspergillus saccharolyticus JOP 1030-1]PYH48126.1 acetyl-CoA synthetase-like protein [Aspergillus saccharolyticus JOP 1030-1]